jgi:hypothetical protein
MVILLRDILRYLRAVEALFDGLPPHMRAAHLGDTARELAKRIEREVGDRA